MKVPEGAAALRRGRRAAALLLPLEERHRRTSSTGSSREWRSSSAPSFRVTRDADFEVSDEADDLLEAVELELRRRRFGDVGPARGLRRRCRARMLERLRGLDVRSRSRSIPIRGLLDLADSSQIAALDRPELKDEPWVPGTPARLAAARGGDDFFSEIRARRHPRPPPVRLVRDDASNASSRGRARSGRDRAQDDRLPHERRLAGRAGADRGGGGRASRACASWS